MQEVDLCCLLQSLAMPVLSAAVTCNACVVSCSHLQCLCVSSCGPAHEQQATACVTYAGTPQQQAVHDTPEDSNPVSHGLMSRWEVVFVLAVT